jgi:IS5 family transposase
LNKAFPKEPAAPGGRPPCDYALMFKILLLQQWYSIADDMTEYLINDRLSFQRFLSLSLGEKVPDAKTIWLFRENLTKSGEYKELFDLFGRQMQDKGLITRSGSIVDASFVDAPKQRNTREENKAIKEGNADGLWKDNPHKCRQKDKDARWAKKNDETHYGYKDHIKIDRDSKMIVDYSVTDAAVHDSQAIIGLIDTPKTKKSMETAHLPGKRCKRAYLRKNPA